MWEPLSTESLKLVLGYVFVFSIWKSEPLQLKVTLKDCVKEWCHDKNYSSRLLVGELFFFSWW